MMEPNDFDLLSLAEAAKIAKVSDQTIRRLVQRGEIIGYKIGKNTGAVYRVDRPTFLVWLESCRVSPNDEG